LVTTEFVRELVKGLGRNTILEVLPDNVLARNEFVTAWWTPAAARTLFFHENTELAPITGKKFPTPALVFKITSGGQLSIRALAESRRPERGTALFHASFWNVYLDGKVCHGTMRVPQDLSLESLPHWEKAFFGSNFSHTIRDEVCLHPAGSTGLWKQLAGAFGTFPVGFLKPSGDTLEEFVTHV
jgi:PRTRC genetic system protein B